MSHSSSDGTQLRSDPARAPAGALVDALGVEHDRAGPRPRIVSLVPSLTELLFELGLGPSIVGRTTFCVHPRAAVEPVPRVGGTKTVRLERLQRLEPTHVIVNIDENRREDVTAIARFVPHVVVTHPIEPKDNIALFRLLGGIFDRADAASALERRFEVALERLEAESAGWPRRDVLYLIWKDPWMTVSRDTYISRTLALANLQTLGHDPSARYPEIALEPALLEQTHWILLSSEPFPFARKHLQALGARHPRHRDKLRLIDAEMVSWYGSRAVPGLDYLRRFVAEDRQ